ncbi:LysR family transcriptional regulator [Aestuariispira ectoiniformans]|uniref:LysR family transcriptional regulator n=1 Tax=Aestuariispira ectoiniformans TaxID=2775080 RepID=UPI00223C0D22|nr:LysR family transcriptional regulator [Aestuariispira ectoiniformans]
MTFNNEKMGWEDLRLFFAVAENGGLSGAVGATGASAPTLSRRMAALERTIGAALFDRRHSGYKLTSAGRELFEYVRGMTMQAQLISNWQENLDPRPVVRITAGIWTSVFIARNLSEICEGRIGLRIELLTGADFLNLSRREADIAIRNQKPEQQGLARKRIGPVHFAIYGATDYVESHPDALTEARYMACDWVVSATKTGASTAWLQLQLAGQAAKLVCGTAQTILEAVGAGEGLCILPCFIGDADARLRRCSPTIDELCHTQWLVSHDDDRHLPHIRQVSAALADLFESRQDSFGREGG